MSTSTPGNNTSTGTPPTDNNNNNTTSTGNPNPNGRGRGRGDRAKNGNQQSMITGSRPKDWQGNTPEIGGVLGLPSDVLENKQSHQKFKKSIEDYILREYTELGRFLVAPLVLGKKAIDTYKETSKPTKEKDDDEDVQELLTYEFKEKMKMYVNNQSRIESATVACFAKIEGNCSDGVLQQLENKDGYYEKKLSGDIIWLMIQLKEISSGLEQTKNKVSKLYDALKLFMSMYQGETESDDNFLSRYKDSVDTLFNHGGEHVFVSDQIYRSRNPSNLLGARSDAESKALSDEFQAVAFIKKLNRRDDRYGSLFDDFKTEVNLGRDPYPTTMPEAHEIISKYKSSKTRATNTNRNGNRERNPNNQQQGNNPNGKSKHHSFAMRAGETAVPGTNGVVREDTRCYKCNKIGHIATFCPSTNGVAMIQLGISLAQREKDGKSLIPPTWVLLDTCSSTTTFCNRDLFKDIRDATSDEMVLLFSDAGSQIYDKIGKIKFLPMEAMYNPKGIANVISLKDISSLPGVVVKMDTAVTSSITVSVPELGDLVFQRSKDGLHFLDVAGHNGIKETLSGYSFNQIRMNTTPMQSPHVIPDDDSFQNVPSPSIQPQGADIPPSSTITSPSGARGTHKEQEGTQNEQASVQGAQGAHNSQNQSSQNQLSQKSFQPTQHNHIDVITTVKNNMQHFTKKDINKAIEARRTQQIIGWPSQSSYLKIIEKNHLNNTDITCDDVLRAEYIFGTPVPLLKGKMTRPPSTPSYNLKKVNIPLPILQHHKNIDLFVDFMYVNGLPFLHTISSKLQYRTIKLCKSRETDEIQNAITSAISSHESRGFIIENIHGDNEFNNDELIENLKPKTTIIYPPREHVKEIERSIRTMKERSRSTCHAVPYKRYTKLMTKHLMKYITEWLNMFPSENSVSKSMSPASIVEGIGKPDMKKNRVPFGTYVMLYSETNNNMKERGVEAIALSDAGPRSGYYFMSLKSGKQLHGYSWKVLPITDLVIDRVEELAIDENQPYLPDTYPTFEWSPGQQVEDIILDSNYALNSNDDDESILEEIQQIDNEEEDDDEEIIEAEIIRINRDDPNNNEAIITDEDTTDEDSRLSYDIQHDSETETEEENEERINNTSDDADISYDSSENMDIEEELLVENVTDEYTSSEEEYSTDNEPDMNEDTNNNDRPRRANAGTGVDRLEMAFDGKSYDQARLKVQFAQVKFRAQSKRWSKRKRIHHATQLLMKAKEGKGDGTIHEHLNVAMHVMFTQMSAKRGIKLFGEEAIAAIYKEYKQLDEGAKKGNPVVTPTPIDTLTDEEKRQALEAVNLIKQKRCGKIKGRCAANGSKQRQYLKPEESVASPTCSLEGLLATLVIDAKEGRQVNTFDVPGAFLQAPMPEGKKVLLKMRGEFVDIMCRVNPEHVPNVIYEGKEKVLYLRVERAIYGCIESALQWFIMFTEVLEKQGFELNPYDRCVANKTINGKQCTVVWYVDDVKISHMDQAVLDDITNLMQEEFGPMEIVKGDTHAYLGMNITIHRKEKLIEIEMKQQLLETIEAFKGVVEKSVCSPAAKHIFDTRDGEVEKLNEEMKENFHHITAKLLHIMKRARPDIEVPIVFLCTRVKSPDTDDWKKLQRVLEWIQDTVDETRFIGADNLYTLFTWIDAAYAVHPNMRSHTGGAISMGTGVMHCKSGRQKLNTKSSTESELVGVSDYLPYAIWFMYFMKEQGYELISNVLYQDNQSAMKMERNGRNSCTGNSRHVNIRYFWVKDRIDKGEFELKYCATDRMLADFYTKALQGSTFKKFWYVIMGHKPICSLEDEDDIPNLNIKERVEGTIMNKGDLQGDDIKIVNKKEEKREGTFTGETKKE